MANIKPETSAEQVRYDMALELLDDVRRLDDQTKASHRRIRLAIKASGTSLTEICGVGPIVAAQLIGFAGDVRRFANRDAFASHNGTAPVESASGGRVVLYGCLLESGKRRSLTECSALAASATSTRSYHKALSDAVKKGTLVRNVAEVASPPSAKSTKPPEMAWWTPEQLRTFLGATSDDALGPLFRVAAMTGMRRGEVCGLRWPDVDLDRAVLEVRQQLLVVRSPGAADGGLLFSETTKTDRGRRKIDLDPGTLAVLRRQWRRQAEQQLATGSGWRNNERNLVFTESDGNPLGPRERRQGVHTARCPVRTPALAVPRPPAQPRRAPDRSGRAAAPDRQASRACLSRVHPGSIRAPVR